jgi:hypothetical protein
MGDMDITEQDMQGIPCTCERGESRYIEIYFFSQLFKYILVFVTIYLFYVLFTRNTRFILNFCTQ